VSATGSFDYLYPIKVPPRRNGVTPELALVYTSAEAQEPSRIRRGLVA
jgi:hypothetical protein